jgi:hypothetical protein
MKMKHLLILILTTLPAIALAERPPTDIELRAGYCVPVVKYNIELVTDLVKSMDTGQTASTPELRKMSSELLATYNDRLQRLNNYLVPKAGIVDLVGLQVAINLGAEDVKYSKEQLPVICSQKCKEHQEGKAIMSCISTCGQEDERNMRKNRQCGDLNWLPF